MMGVDEIKERVDTFRVEYVYLESMQTYLEAEADMRYLLDRIAKLESVIREYIHGNRDEKIVATTAMIAALDNDDEEETTHGD